MGAFLAENWQTGAALLVAGFCAGWVGVRILGPFLRRRGSEQRKGSGSSRTIEIDPPSRN